MWYCFEEESFEVREQGCVEWADYIAFQGSILRAVRKSRWNTIPEPPSPRA